MEAEVGEGHVVVEAEVGEGDVVVEAEVGEGHVDVEAEVGEGDVVVGTTDLAKPRRASAAFLCADPSRF